MATYSTDLTTITTAESGSWTEFASPYNGGGSPASNAENYIQGTGCYSQTTGKATDLEISIVFNNTTGYTFGTDDVLFAWVYYAVGVNLYGYSAGGWRFGIGSSVSAWDYFTIGGSDYGRNPYGGWFNVAIDPTATQTGVIGGGNGGTYQYFGSVPNTIGEISKGEPSAMDALREGRGVISLTGSSATFSELAEYNDYNAGSTPPGSSSTSVDSGYHRLGLFQAQGGIYLWKGLLSLGVTGTSATFTDSNETIIIDDCPHTYPAFNKIEVHNASSTITLTNITVTSTATTANGIGHFEMMDDATMTLTGCSFNDMGTFIFDSNSDVYSTTFNGCAQITTGGADMATSNVLSSTVAADTGAVYCDTAYTDTYFDGMTFSKGTNAHHAIAFGTSVTGNLTLRNCAFNGFGSTDDSNDSTVQFLATSGSLTLSLVDCTVDGAAATTSNFSVDDAVGTLTVTVSIDPVTLTVHVNDNDGDDLPGVKVYLRASDGTGDLPFEDSVTGIARSGTTATVDMTAHGMNVGEYIKLYGITGTKIVDTYGAHEILTVADADTFTYATADSGETNYTGTITATGVLIYGDTSAVGGSEGDITASRTLANNQPLTGFARKSTASPRFKSFRLDTTMANDADTNINVRLILDE